MRTEKPKDACTHWTDGVGYCGVREGMKGFIGGLRCPDHTPARLAGHPEAAPDPARTLAGIQAAAREARS